MITKTNNIRRQQIAVFGILGSIALSVAFSHTAAAKPPADLARFNGHYVYAKSSAHGEKVIERALEKAFEHLNIALRTIAKAALNNRKQKLLIQNINIWIDDTVNVKLDDQPAIAKLDVPKKIKNPEGNDAKLLYRFRGGKLEQILSSSRGSISTIYKLEADGKTLHRYTTIKGDKLKHPIRIKLTYKRK